MYRAHCKQRPMSIMAVPFAAWFYAWFYAWFLIAHWTWGDDGFSPALMSCLTGMVLLCWSCTDITDNHIVMLSLCSSRLSSHMRWASSQDSQHLMLSHSSTAVWKRWDASTSWVVSLIVNFTMSPTWSHTLPWASSLVTFTLFVANYQRMHLFTRHVHSWRSHAWNLYPDDVYWLWLCCVFSQPRRCQLW